jgi:pyruvate formate lyase activating enzyme
MKNAVNFPLENISPFTLLDFPDKTACILWFAGCNMRCQYCYNPEIVFSNGKISYETALIFLKKRIGLLDGVVFSGGECTISKGFVAFVEKVKSLGFQIKIDTNGSRPDIIKELIDGDLVDYIALDFKAPAEKYFEITRSKLFHRFELTLERLISSKIQFEVRTTIHEDLLNLKALKGMAQNLITKKYQGTYYLQHFINDSDTINMMQRNTLKVKEDDFDDISLSVFVRN